ncbi:hypothetical protein J14TS2_23860 [Bacillus sp. J14TS2]|uniref:hypothetical protein n=1 Tax=Bacillus sp. J14TS2 TaxID=2807188 RepID=UPI001B05458C|nr:hypothetical protein [Bacillus sp. J14TS2]GIN71911.1 hypothetical protein J14TS2_23860 [Bacillus sp. J14TS2]
MDISLGLIASLILNIGLLLIVFAQSKKTQVLRQQNQKMLYYESNDELLALVEEKLGTLGEVKAIKYLRLEKGMSMLDAKKLVDSLQETK